MMCDEDNKCYTVYVARQVLNQKGPRFLAILSLVLSESTNFQLRFDYFFVFYGYVVTNRFEPCPLWWLFTVMWVSPSAWDQ